MDRSPDESGTGWTVAKVVGLVVCLVGMVGFGLCSLVGLMAGGLSGFGVFVVVGLGLTALSFLGVYAIIRSARKPPPE